MLVTQLFVYCAIQTRSLTVFDLLTRLYLLISVDAQGSQFRGPLQQTLGLLQQYYPEAAKHTYFVHAPLAFRTLFGIAFNFVHPNTQKATSIDGKWNPQKAGLDRAQLPDYLGGTWPPGKPGRFQQVDAKLADDAVSIAATAVAETKSTSSLIGEASVPSTWTTSATTELKEQCKSIPAEELCSTGTKSKVLNKDRLAVDDAETTAAYEMNAVESSSAFSLLEGIFASSDVTVCAVNSYVGPDNLPCSIHAPRLFVCAAAEAEHQVAGEDTNTLFLDPVRLPFMLGAFAV
eukprot:SAG31_NODE_9266_length_1306_cov_5.203559_1_plen_290_part_00